MTTFEIGKKYFDTHAGDHTLVSSVEIVKRTAQTVTFRRGKEERRAKIYTDAQGEYIMPDRYSMACVYRASREYTEEAVAVATGIRNNGPQVRKARNDGPDAPAQQPTVVMVGQPVVADWGAMYPQERGTVSGFCVTEATRWFPSTVYAIIRWEDGHTSQEELSSLHPMGWRSPNGSGIGVFLLQ